MDTSKRVFYCMLVFMLASAAVSATTVELSSDKNQTYVGESIRFTLHLYSDKKISGALTIVNLDEKKQERILFQSIKPGCTCSSDTRVEGDFTDTSSFKPVKTGNYQARAYFDQAEKTVNFTVKEHTPSTTTSTSTSTTTSTTTTSTTTTDTTTTTTSSTVTSTTIEQAAEPVSSSIFDQCPCEWAPFIIAGILIFLALVDAVYKYISGGRK